MNDCMISKKWGDIIPPCKQSTVSPQVVVVVHVLAILVILYIVRPFFVMTKTEQHTVDTFNIGIALACAVSVSLCTYFYPNAIKLQYK